MIFIIFSLYYLYVIRSIVDGHGVFNKEKFFSFFLDQKLLLGLGLVALWSIFKMKRYSKEIIPLFGLFIFFKSFYMFYESGHKVILLGTFVYLPMAFLLYLLWVEELGSSLLNPNFYKNQLYRKDKYPFWLTLTDNKGREYAGQLTNWDEYSCFTCIKPYKKGLRGLVNITVHFLGRKFVAQGLVMTGYDDGLGIKFVQGGEKKGSTLGWKDFYAIMVDRGMI